MGKKKKVGKSKNNENTEEMLSTLPQNIVSVGERVYENKNIYIHQKVYRDIHRFASGTTAYETGGILVGKTVEELGKENIIIEGFIEAKHNEATETTLTFTHKTWEYFHAVRDKKYKDKKIVGWIHTHPNYDVFLSENDRFIQDNYSSDPGQVAYVVDPVQEDEGFFFWIDGKLERCTGFYLFDKVGAKIEKGETEEAEIVKEKDESIWDFVFKMILVILIAALAFWNVSLNARINHFEKQNEAITRFFYGVTVINTDDLKEQQHFNRGE